MRKSRFALFLTTISVLLLYAACGIPLDPAWKSTTEATLSLSLGVPGVSDSSSSRAIIQGAGYLYIRTFGGPKGSSGPVYGPYSVKSGETFSTKDIPAGSYSDMAFIFSAQPLDSRTFVYGGVTYTFAEGMRTLSDDTLKGLEHSADGGSFAAMLGGMASGGLVSGVKIEEGKTNAIKATLVPIVDSYGWIPLYSTQYKDVTSDGSGLIKRFFALDGVFASVPAGKTIDTLSMTLTATAASEIGAVALYDEKGTLLKSFVGPGAVPAGGTAVFTSPCTKTSECYLYVEYKSTNFRMSFDRTLKDDIIPASSGLSVRLTGASGYAGKNFVFALVSLDPTSVMSGPSSSSSSSSSSGPDGFIGWGMGKIGTDGTATVLAMNETLTAPIDPAKVAGPAYLLAFIDTDNSITDLATAEFDDKDLYYFSEDPLALSGTPQIIPVDKGAFLAYTGGSTTSGSVKVQFTGTATFASHNFFFGIQTSPASGPASTSGLVGAGSVMLDASGSGTGVPVDLKTGKPLVLTAGVTYYLTAFVDINDNYKTVTTLSSADISGIMPHAGDYATDTPIPFTVSSSGVISITPANLHVSTNNVLFAAQAAAGTGTGGSPANACTIETALAKANASSGETSLYIVGTVTPGAVLKATSKIMIMGTSSSSVLKLSGSGMLASAGSEVVIMGVPIDATTYAGTASPLQVETGGMLILYQSVFTGNSTTSAVVNGGAVSVAGGSFALYDATIKSASATGNGGAVYVANPSGATTYSAMFMMMNASKIQYCHAGSAGMGGAVYVAASSAVSLSGSESFSGNLHGSSVLNDIYTEAITSYIADPASLISSGKVIHSGSGTISASNPFPTPTFSRFTSAGLGSL